MRCGIVALPAPFISPFNFSLENSQKEFPAGGILKTCAFQKIRSIRAACFKVNVSSRAVSRCAGIWPVSILFKISRFTEQQPPSSQGVLERILHKQKDLYIADTAG